MKLLQASTVVLLVAGQLHHHAAASPSEVCLNETAAIVEDNPSLASYAGSLEQVFDNCTNATETSVATTCVYIGPESDSFRTMDGGVYYECDWTITCEASRNE